MPETVPAPHAATARPRIGLLGIMQSLYDDMLPGIAERQAAFARRLADRLADVADVRVAEPAKDREQIEQRVLALHDEGVEGLMVVMLTYGPSLRALRALAEARLPILLANVQPEPTVGRDWTMAEMTYNQGVHGAQDLANVLMRADVPFEALSEDWREEGFRRRFEDWARAAAAATRCRELRVAVFGHAMRGTGDFRFDAAAFLHRFGPDVESFSPGELVREAARVGDDEVRALLADEDARYEVDEALTAEAREEAARLQIALQRHLERGNFGAYSAHFEAIGGDGRFGRLPLSAASALMAQGYGYGAEGDATSAALVAAGHVLGGPAHFTEMYAMDFARDSVLLSHMGEGNPALARGDEAVRLVDRELEIGGLGRPPTTVFRLRPGAATLTSLAPTGAGRFRLVVAEGEIVDEPPIPALEMPYGSFRPDGGVRACLDRWLEAGGTHHQCLVGGRRATRWRSFARMLELEAAFASGG